MIRLRGHLVFSERRSPTRKTGPGGIAGVHRRRPPCSLPGMCTNVAHGRVKGMSPPFKANAIWGVEHLWIEDE